MGYSEKFPTKCKKRTSGVLANCYSRSLLEVAPNLWNASSTVFFSNFVYLLRQRLLFFVSNWRWEMKWGKSSIPTTTDTIMRSAVPLMWRWAYFHIRVNRLSISHTFCALWPVSKWNEGTIARISNYFWLFLNKSNAVSFQKAAGYVAYASLFFIIIKASPHILSWVRIHLFDRV